jgi:hypothetical protein
MSNTDKLGATGEFPRGKLNADDEGALNCSITHGAGVVRIDFGKEIAWLAMDPGLAINFASAIMVHARELLGR